MKPPTPTKRTIQINAVSVITVHLPQHQNEAPGPNARILHAAGLIACDLNESVSDPHFGPLRLTPRRCRCRLKSPAPTKSARLLLIHPPRNHLLNERVMKLLVGQVGKLTWSPNL
jgi:hypothetical protein